MNKTLLFAACSLLIAGCCTGCKESGKAAPAKTQAPPPPAVVTGKVVLKDNIEKRTYVGVVSAPAVVTLMPRISGELLEVRFKEGQAVKAGQVLYIFDKTRYEAAVKNADAKIAECKARITECDARLIYAESDYKRKLSLHKQNAAAATELENARSTRDAQLSAKTAAEAALRAAEAQLITAKDDLANTVITAPMNGVIGVNNFARGNYITPSSGALATINQIAPIRVEFAMSNRDFLEMFGTEQELKKEAKIKLQLANDKLFDEIGSVEFIDNNVNRRTDTIQVFARFCNAKEQLRPGSSVSVMIERNIGANSTAVPPSAVMPSGGDNFFVYVVDNKNMAAKREVKVTTQRDDYVFIASGVKAGETVIIDGTHKVRIMKPGAQFPVAPVPAEGEKAAAK